MIRIFGDFLEKMPNEEEYIIIGFSPSSLCLQKRWRNNGLSADFVANFFKTFFTSYRENDSDDEETRLENLKLVVKYIVNELLENAMKFQGDKLPFAATIKLSLYKDKLIFCMTNGTTPQQADYFQTFIQRLLSDDPTEMYFHSMKNSSKLEANHDSGLGLLSMICDFSARLGWKFERIPNNPSFIIVDTMVHLQIF